ncbi:MAG: ADP-forming succinate--CoA ligase subunit beta [Phycisphaerales bacterium]|jgi:succinyl-CoA synthetase beta subunit|nr:ADP-forming succinate--CoA ligase subunit beta [Phycisphaerales bacterium]
MKIHEYQARELLSTYQIPVPSGRMIETAADAGAAFDQAVAGMASPLAVVKAQVYAGGRGKAGFVKLVKTRQEAIDAATFMLSNRMVSPQTPPEGLEVKKLLVAQAADIADRKGGGKDEFYLAITLDRKIRRNVLIASREGGVEIETIAHERPEAIIKQPLDPLRGLTAYDAREVAIKLGFVGKQIGQAADIMIKLAKCYVEKDCTIAEINPLVITPPDAKNPDGRVIALDAKFNFDENGVFRHNDVEAMYDPTEENPAEIRAKKFNLSYVALDGNIGCLVNGAGLAMATMDIIKLEGGEPANFLDVGGGATEEAVTEAFGIILSDPRCKGVLVNIFGGIMKCDVIAQGIVNAAKGFKNRDGSIGFKVPLVVRLEGTNVDAGRKLLDDSKAIVPTLQSGKDLGDAARKVVKAVGRG